MGPEKRAEKWFVKFRILLAGYLSAGDYRNFYGNLRLVILPCQIPTARSREASNEGEYETPIGKFQNSSVVEEDDQRQLRARKHAAMGRKRRAPG